jgi:hypothetical protein
MQRTAPYRRKKLTHLDATRARPQDRTFVIWDTQQRGLGLRVQPSGHRAYVFVYRHSGRSRWITIAPANALELTEARRRAAKLMLDVLDGKDPAGERKATSVRTPTLTFATLAHRYVAEFSQRRNKSWRQAEALIRRNVLPLWADRDPSTITRADVRAILAKITAPVLQNQVLAAVSAVYTWASRQEILAVNPARGVERNQVTSRERVLSDAEVPQFWQAFGKAGIPGMALRVLLLLGQRPGEIQHMRREHVTSDGWWTMPGSPEPATGWPGTKNANTHRV